MKGISVYLLDDASREELAAEFPPMFDTFVGHHVTFQFKSSDSDPLPEPGLYHVVGYAYEKERRMDGGGIEALVVEIDGTTTRLDGEIYHITWSHSSGYSAKDSKRLVKGSYEKLPTPIQIHMTPAFIPFN